MKDFYNEEYERVLIAAMLLDNEIIDSVKSKVSAECFHNPKYRLIFETIINQYVENGCSNTLTLIDKLNKINPVEIAELSNATVSSANWEFYARKIKNLSTTRVMKREINSLFETLDGDNVEEVINEANSKLSSYIGSGDNNGVDAKNMCVDIPEKMLETYKRYKSGQTLLGYDCGYEELNNILDGFQTGTFYIIGARPSIGKTAFGLNLINNLCKNKIPSTIFSLEMSYEKLFYRLSSQVSGIPTRKIEKGLCFATRGGMARFQNAMRTIFEYPLCIYDEGVDVDTVLYSKIRMEAKVKGTKVFLIDHLGLVQSSNTSGNRYVDVGKITATLHKMVKELNVCIILLCQCGREAEGKEPTLSLLRESGNIEQDADVVMLLSRKRDMNEANVPTKVIVAKQRDGSIGEVDMTFQLPFSRFREGDPSDVNNTYEEKPEVSDALF